MNKTLERYRELAKTSKTIACFFITAKKDNEGKLYADLNAGWVIGLLNADDGLLETFLEDTYQVIEDFGIIEEGQYEIEAILNWNEEQRSFAPPVQADFKAYYELEYSEITQQFPLEGDNEEYTESFDMDFGL